MRDEPERLPVSQQRSDGATAVRDRAPPAHPGRPRSRHPRRTRPAAWGRRPLAPARHAGSGTAPRSARPPGRPRRRAETGAADWRGRPRGPAATPSYQSRAAPEAETGSRSRAIAGPASATASAATGSASTDQRPWCQVTATRPAAMARTTASLRASAGIAATAYPTRTAASDHPRAWPCRSAG